MCIFTAGYIGPEYGKKNVHSYFTSWTIKGLVEFHMFTPPVCFVHIDLDFQLKPQNMHMHNHFHLLRIAIEREHT